MFGFSEGGVSGGAVGAAGLSAGGAAGGVAGGACADAAEASTTAAIVEEQIPIRFQLVRCISMVLLCRCNQVCEAFGPRCVFCVTRRHGEGSVSIGLLTRGV